MRVYFNGHVGWEVVLNTTEDREEVSELGKFVVHGSRPVLSYGTILDCISASAMNAVHPAVYALAANAVLEYAGKEPRNGCKHVVAS